MHAAMRSLLASLASDAPLVVILDDLHWADPSSIDLIAALLRRPPAAAVLLALSFRHRQARRASRPPSTAPSAKAGP